MSAEFLYLIKLLFRFYGLDFMTDVDDLFHVFSRVGASLHPVLFLERVCNHLKMIELFKYTCKNLNQIYPQHSLTKIVPHCSHLLKGFKYIDGGTSGFLRRLGASLT